MSKKTITIMITITLLVLVALISFFLIQKAEKEKRERLSREAKERERKEVTIKSVSFAVAWGTYDYKSYPEEYLKNIRPYLEDSYYNQNFTKNMGFIKATGSIKQNQESATSSVIKPLYIRDITDGYSAKLQVLNTLTDKRAQTKKERGIIIDWKKVGNDYKVIKTGYEI